MQTKEVLGVVGSGSNHWVGDGFPVRNLFPSNGVSAEVNPFLMLDYAGPAEFDPTDRPRGVGEHPHRGFETVTIAYQGAVEHRDSAGNSGVIHPGDVQWMTAASGLVHEEKHEREFARKGGVFEMVQLWVNLPREHKMSPPRYQPITAAEIPHVPLGEGAYARIVAGELNGVTGPAKTFTPINLVDVRMEAGSRAEMKLPRGHNPALVLLKGGVMVSGSHDIQGEARLVLLSPEGDAVTLEAVADSTLLVLTGEPIDEPVVSHGPFVMNTRGEIQQAMRDYAEGKMGRLG